MAQTTSTSVTELVLAKAVDLLIGHYQFDEVNLLPYARFKSIAGEPTATGSFARAVKDAHSDLATEGTALTAVEFETTAVDIAVARIGIARNPTETAMEDTVLGRAGFMMELIQDTARLLGLATEEDFLAEFANATNSVTDAGSALAIADLVSAMSQQRTAKVRGPHVFGLSDNQAKNLQAAQAAATATPWATFYQPNADGSSFLGFFMGAPAFATGLNTTANTGANDVGGLFADGQAAPKYAAFGYVTKREPMTRTKFEPLEDAEYMATTARRGVGTIAANFATKITTSATA